MFTDLGEWMSESAVRVSAGSKYCFLAMSVRLNELSAA